MRAALLCLGLILSPALARADAARQALQALEAKDARQAAERSAERRQRFADFKAGLGDYVKYRQARAAKVDGAYEKLAQLSAREEVQGLRKVLAKGGGVVHFAAFGESGAQQILSFGPRGFYIEKIGSYTPPGPGGTYLSFSPAPLKKLGVVKRASMAGLDTDAVALALYREIAKLPAVAEKAALPDEWKLDAHDWWYRGRR